jgi:23S rRNA (cytosine1962-C5)-methyltransferase
VYEKRVGWIDRGAASGDVVEVATKEGRPVGYAFLHRGSVVALRMLSRNPSAAPDDAWLVDQLARAAALRRDVLRLGDVTNAWRVVHAEGDGLSGLVVDRYGPVAVVSLFSLGWALRCEALERALRHVLGVEHVVFRVDARTAEQEGIDLPEPDPLPPVEVHEHGVLVEVHPTGGHKTGYFLDQRDNRRFVAGLARDRRVFDGMTYSGGFALAAAQAGAREVVAMDLDEEAVEVAKANARRNQLAIDVRHGDVFHGLRALLEGPAEARPDVLVLDPPKWAKARDGVQAAIARYRDLNRLGFQVLPVGGVLVTHSCSGLVSEGEFLQMLCDAARDIDIEAQVIRIAGAAPDHPVDLRAPEGRYLKSVALVRTA